MRLRFVPKGESWRLSLLRDYIDTSMIRVVHQMVWYPVAYSLLIVPISLARLSEYDVPPWAVLGTDVLYNIQGVVNVILLLGTQRVFPPTKDLPAFKPRRTLDLGVFARHGVTPFVVAPSPSPSPTDEKENLETSPIQEMPLPPSQIHSKQYPPAGWI